MEICFALCSNRRYFPGLRLTLASALLSSSQYAFYKVWIMHSDYTETEIDALRHIAGRTKRRVEIRFIEINENRFHGLNRQTNGSLLAYAPFLLSEYIDEARIFFIDCDLIVVNPLETFYNIDLKGNCIMGVVDRWMTHLKDDCPFPISKEEECLPYINTGFLLIDLVAWKKNNYNEQFLEILKAREPKLNYFDQTLINYLCRGNILEGSSSLNGLIWREDGLALFCCNNRVLSNLHFVTQPKATSINLLS